MDIDALDRVVTERIVTRFDHRDLNQDPEFAARTTTGENLVLLIWDLLVTLEVPVGIDRAGIVIVGGLNPVAVLEEHGIATESRAMSTLYEYSRLAPFKGLANAGVPLARPRSSAA